MPGEPTTDAEVIFAVSSRSCRRVSKCCGREGGRPSLRPPPRLRITSRIMADSQGELLLLVPTTSYRLDDFRAAALRLGVPLVVGSDRCHKVEDFFGEEKDLLSLDYRQPARAAEQIADAARTRPIRGIVPASDPTAVIAALAAERLGLPHNPPAAARRAANKLAMREALRDAGVAVPAFRAFPLDSDPLTAASEVSFPCVLKPLILSASRGVIRADDPAGFVGAWRRIETLLRDTAPERRAREEGCAASILVESFVAGAEVAAAGARALGLVEGPVHAELRLGADGPVVLEIAARSIGGLCSRTLRFGAGLSLEEVLVAHAMGRPLEALRREARASGVMMLPIPRRGVLHGVRGVEAARAVPGVEDVVVTVPEGREVVPLPEGDSYLGFLFARGEAPADVEAALREAHERLVFEIRAALPVA